ncbi:MAG: hypothetical protein BJ554DRAFT_6058 [Olpidium bornovanus]|uniref:Uncharacterized protein n=1 Tax=Olpidium bornovanus TaxID=278681 RepID=A0A8H7ZYT1_9FUNG|nr:MAG: hypothetical protein BJ554DRAFT_6058 [Olpidium bornovanus]
MLPAGQSSIGSIVEAALVGGGNHLGNVKHKGCFRVTSADALSTFIIERALVQVLDTIRLRGDRRREVDDHHLQQSVGSRQKTLHNNLEESLALKILLDDLEFLDQLEGFLFSEIHDAVEKLVDRVKDKHVKRALQVLAISVLRLVGPLFRRGIEVVLAPQAGNHLVHVHTKLLRVPLRKLAEGKRPPVKTGSERDCAFLRVHLDIAKRLVEIGRNDDIDGFNGCCSSRSARSTLLMMTTGLIFSTVSVWTQTPSTQSTTTRAPSVTRSAAVTSDEKSTCPGESMRFIKKPFPSVFCLTSPTSSAGSSKKREMAVDLMVIPRSCSS